jgi:hypothetical protein
VLDSVPLHPSDTSFRAGRGRNECQPPSSGPAPTGAGRTLRVRQGFEKSPTALAPTQDGPRYDVRLLNTAGAYTIIVSGEVDSVTAPGLRDCLLDVLGSPHLRDVHVEVDLSGVTFVDAAGPAAIAGDHVWVD